MHHTRTLAAKLKHHSIMYQGNCESAAARFGMISLWQHIYGEQLGVLALLSGVRPGSGSKKLQSVRTAHFDWPVQQERARVWVVEEAAAGCEVYHGAHLFTKRRRVKENAASVWALWADGDGAKATNGLFEPTAIVESSPGRLHLYCRLSRPVAPEFAEALNRRWAIALGADPSGYDLTQLLRPPGTPNRKYEGAPLVRMLRLKHEPRDPAELDRLLPPLMHRELQVTKSYRPQGTGPVPDLRRLSQRIQNLIRRGNRGEYGCRSRADMAACVAMFSAGYSEEEVWAVMANPRCGISEKFVEKGRHGKGYLALTIGKAQAVAKPKGIKRQGVVSLGPPKAEAGVVREAVIRLD